MNKSKYSLLKTVKSDVFPSFAIITTVKNSIFILENNSNQKLGFLSLFENKIAIINKETGIITYVPFFLKFKKNNNGNNTIHE